MINKFLFVSLSVIFLSLLFTNCNNVAPDGITVLQVHLEDSLSIQAGLYDSVRIDLTDKDGAVYMAAVFSGPYDKVKDKAKLEDIEVPANAPTPIHIVISAYKGKVKQAEFVFQVAADKVAKAEPSTFIPPIIKKDSIPKNDTSIIQPSQSEIIAPSDTSVSEGDSVGFHLGIRNPMTGNVTLSIKEPVAGLKLDTAGSPAGEGFLSWRPNFDQGRSEPYQITLVYANAEKKTEKLIRILVRNTNRPPKLLAVPDQKTQEDVLITFKVNASDPDNDSLTYSAASLPSGATFTGTTFSWKPSVGQAGNYSIRFSISDGKDSDLVVGLVSVGDVAIPPAPVVIITSPAQDTTVNFTPFTILYTVNGTPLQKRVALKDGKTRIFIDTTIAGRTGLDTVTITLDTVPPIKPTVAGPSPVSTRTPTWTWTSGGGGNGTYRYRLDAEDVSAGTQTSEVTYTASKDLDPGTHTLYVQERDLAGNWSLVGKRSVRIDTTRPAAPIVNGEGLTSNNPRPTWSWQGSGDDASGLFRYKLDNSDLRTGATETKTVSFAPKAGEELKEGVHTLYVQQQDSAGNWSNSGNASIKVDLTAPNVPKVKTTQTSPTNVQKPEWTWTSGGNGGSGAYRLKIDDSTFATGGISNTTLSYSPDTLLKQGPHTLFIQEQDSAGNWSKTSSATIYIDLTPPGIPTVISSSWHTTNQRPKWTWTSGGNGGIGTYRCKVDDSLVQIGATTINDTAFAPSADLSIGAHTLYVQERDSAGNWSASGSMTLRIHGQVGYAVGDGGTVYKSVSGGASWDTIPRKTTKRFYSVFFTDANNGIAVGEKSGYAGSDRATILKTVNSGASSDTITNPMVWDLTSVFFTSATTGFVVGYAGTMGQTTDGGASWKLVNSSTSKVLTSIYFPDASHGYAVGRGGAIIRTNDGGATWKTTTTTITEDLNSVYFLNTKLGFIVGNKGVIYQSTDGGDTWNSLVSGSTFDLQSVFFTDPKRGYIAAHDVLLKTADGGLTWKSVSTPATPYLNSVYFTDENVGFVVGEYGLVMKTVDYGETWNTIGLRTGFDLYSVYFP